MTREEAIARIRNHKIAHKMNEPRAIYISEALDMAIKALEQEPCDDAISRRAALDKSWVIEYPDGTNEKVICASDIMDLSPINLPLQNETVTEFADRCKECGSRYGKLLKQKLCNDTISRQEVLSEDAISRKERNNGEEGMIDFEQYLEKKAENEPHEVAELICLKCFDRAIHTYPKKTLLKHLQCRCGQVGYLIKTGQTLDESENAQ